MDSVLPLFTRHLNETGHSIDFSVEEGRCPIPSLGPGGRGLVNLSEIRNICRRKSSSWWIKVSIDKNLTEMTLEPGNFLKHAQILFKLEENENGKIFIAEGIKDEDIGMTRRLSWNIGFVLGMNDICRGRTYSPIADVLLEFPMNMQQTRQKERKVGKASKFQQKEAKGSLKKRVRNMCGDVAVIPEVLVNPNKRSPLRKEESPQTEVDNSVKHIKANPPKRENGGIAWKAPKSQQRESNDSLKKRETTATYTPLDGSSHDTFETKMSNSSQMEPLHREGNSPDFCCHHQCDYQQQLTEHLEYEHDHPPPPHSFHVSNKDTTDHIFILLCAILGVGLVHMLLLGYKFTH